jgi:uncharacterized coiled-coil DUF342 family protein
MKGRPTRKAASLKKVEMLMEITPEIQTARELATHANELKHLQDDMDKLVKDVEELKNGINEIRKMLAEQQAEKKMIRLYR